MCCCVCLVCGIMHIGGFVYNSDVHIHLGALPIPFIRKSDMLKA